MAALLFVSARLQAAAAAILCLMALQLGLAVARPAGNAGATGVRLALGR